MMENTYPILLVGVNSDGAKQLGKAINGFRRQHGLTPTQLAERVGVHVSFIRGIERGVQAPSMETAKKILDCLPSEDVEVVWTTDDPVVDLIFRQEETELWFRFSAAVQGQNTRGIRRISAPLQVHVAMRLPNVDGSGKTKLLGVYDNKHYAEARCFRDIDNMQPVVVLDCVLNVDLED